MERRRMFCIVARTGLFVLSALASPCAAVAHPVDKRKVVLAEDVGVVCDGRHDANRGGVFAAADALAKSLQTDLVLPADKACRILTGLLINTPHTHWTGQHGTVVEIDAAARPVTNSSGSTGAIVFTDFEDLQLDGITFRGAGAATTTGVSRVMGQNLRHVRLHRDTFRDFGDEAFFEGFIEGRILTVTAVLSGSLKIGLHIASPGYTAGGNIKALSTGTGGIGTYELDQAVSAPPQTFSGTVYVQGLAIFGGSDIDVDDCDFLDNSGDGLAFGTGSAHVTVHDSRMLGNGDSGLVCTIGGFDFHSSSNTMVAPAGNFAPTLVFDRCHDFSARNDTITGGQSGVRVARYADTPEVNRDFSIVAEHVIGARGACLSVENVSEVQGRRGVGARGGQFSIVGNTTRACGSASIMIEDSDHGEVKDNVGEDNRVDGIAVIARTPGVETGRLTISGNTMTGGRYGIRQIAAGGTLSPSIVSQNRLMPRTVVHHAP